MLSRMTKKLLSLAPSTQRSFHTNSLFQLTPNTKIETQPQIPKGPGPFFEHEQGYETNERPPSVELFSIESEELKEKQTAQHENHGSAANRLDNNQEAIHSNPTRMPR